LAVQTQELVRSVEYATVQSGQELVAAEHFSNLQGVGNLVLVYDETAGTVKITQTVPEPTTATLSLLALVALASRRRRN
ncbi:MAG: PEP-CTERM sorting domain-containing protein, partial [Akkermansia sp.]|nr:PEP-CTERM sorting domain-containing protein [Akkermansia sp.]